MRNKLHNVTNGSAVTKSMSVPQVPQFRFTMMRRLPVLLGLEIEAVLLRQGLIS
jgi:hypothetical protein